MNSIRRALLLPLAALASLAALPLHAADAAPSKAPRLNPVKPDKTGRVVPPDGYRLVWHDEFNGKGRPDPDKWVPETGFVRNKEMQWYQLKNARQSGGRLIITGRRENTPNPKFEKGSKDWRKNRKTIEYSSASLTTKGKFSVTYGILEARVRFNPTEGVWPAFWTTGISENWPSCGEIDILEYYRGKYLANFVWGAKQPWTGIWRSKTVSLESRIAKDPRWAEKFHVFKLDWDEKRMRIFIDDELVNEIATADAVNLRYDKIENPFRQPHFIIINLALGANGGSLDKLDFPARYEVDYVRVFQKEGENKDSDTRPSGDKG